MNAIWHDLIRINGEVAHWLFEAEGLLIGVAWHWLWQRRHDHREHSGIAATLACEAESGIHDCQYSDRHPGAHRCSTCGADWSLDDIGRYHRHPQSHLNLADLPTIDSPTHYAIDPDGTIYRGRGSWTER